MTRFCLTAAGGLASAFVCFGCAGQNVEGRWQGGFPLQGAKVCEIRLDGGRSFNVDCDQNAIVGGGRYSWDGEHLTMTFSVLTRKSQIVEAKPKLEFKVNGAGNAMNLVRNEESFHWTRELSH